MCTCTGGKRYIQSVGCKAWHGLWGCVGAGVVVGNVLRVEMWGGVVGVRAAGWNGCVCGRLGGKV